MQVNQIQDHVSHAILGGNESIAFGMSDSAEFFAILYKTLYSDQILAVVRETLCNAWDAHIEFGCTDIPLDVSLIADELVIRDYGSGIPRKLIGPIYGVMGGSTKVANGEVTGGFGLGCKAPFAYGDHFGVTSWSIEDKHMTVYSMSKSNAEKKGKPGITPIMSIPCDPKDHGLEVKIQIQAHHRQRFIQLVKRVVANGEMKVSFNGDILPVLPFNKMKENFLITNNIITEDNNIINLRYGNVVYPIETTPGFRTEFQSVYQLMEKINNNLRHWTIIFQAQPNTISVTPSRETLSMQDHTVETIKNLFQEFLAKSSDSIRTGCFDLLDKQISKVTASGKLVSLFDPKEKIPGMYASQLETKNYIIDFDEFALPYATHRYPRFDGFRKKDLLGRLNALITSKYGDIGFIQTYRAELIKTLADKNYRSDWWKRRVVQPLISALDNNPEMKSDKMFAYMRTDTNRWHSDVQLRSLKNSPSLGLGEQLPFLRKVLILAYNRAAITERAPYAPIMKNNLGSIEDTFVYLVPRSSKKVEEALAFFEKRNFTIINLTKVNDWENQEVADVRVSTYVPKPKRKGIPILACLQDPTTGTAISTTRARASDCDLIDKPEFIIKIASRNNEDTLPQLSYQTSRDVLKLWGKKGGIVVNVNQEKKYLSMGSMLFEDFILTQIRDQIKTNPRIRESLPFQHRRSPELHQAYRGLERYQNIFDAIYSDKDLLKHFKFTWTLTSEDEIYLDMFHEFKNKYMTGSLKLMQEIDDLVKAIPLDKSINAFFDKIKTTDTVSFLATSNIRDMLKREPTTPEIIKKRNLAKEILIKAIEG